KENPEKYDSKHIQELINLVIVQHSDIFEEYTKNLTDADFREVSFTKTMYRQNISNINFSRSTFTACKFSYISDCNFTDSKLKKVEFTGYKEDEIKKLLKEVKQKDKTITCQFLKKEEVKQKIIACTCNNSEYYNDCNQYLLDNIE
ncbi:MAG: pentapeptide repeat-containing protein, partial [Alphaproteobacteria bacterium]|nr:pentapeptide repeat-containing protein [Alphaproteobacteria bacterium]